MVHSCAQRRERGLPLWALLKAWHGRSRTRWALRQLDACALADLGLTDAQRQGECAKWFWQG
jgi:uncharacterized protein YjiS (DUF1127 family)